MFATDPSIFFLIDTVVRGEFFWFYEVQGVDIFFENGRKLTSLVICLTQDTLNMLYNPSP